ncbi:hypothetical protein WR25_05942 [Diploscapter pachys]|uniref:Uncharacterized protein n=1 Tax=Diploscapter pachys TaxID=2018661 RepID=A0A2A2L6H0_9BILA|nr:hypothetical protein WR25_05942 [Diploscapter pachys]
MAYLYNVKDPLTAEAACIAYYSIGNRSTQIDDDVQFYVEAINHANANLDPSKKTYVYRQFELGSPGILGKGFYWRGPQLDVSRIDRKLCQDRRPVYREPGKMAPMESRENEPLSNWNTFLKKDIKLYQLG